MASSLTLSGDWLISLGNRNQTSGTGNLGTYATNGIAVSAAQCGLGTVESVVIDPAGGYVFEYVASTGKVKAYWSAAVAATPAAAAALAEVDTATNLAGVTFNWRAIGY